MKTHVVILAGGLGTRLAPYTTILPKPLLPLGSISILEFLIQRLVKSELRRITISIGYLGHLVKAVIGDGAKLGAEVDYVEEIEPLGTAGCLGLIHFEEDVTVVLVVNGDTYTDFDFQLGVKELKKRSCPGVIVTALRSFQSEFGVVEIKVNGELERFSEKPIITQQVSTGINYFEVASLRKVRQSGKLDMPELLMKIHLTSTIGVHCLENRATWFDLGRPQDLILANEHFNSNFS